MATIDDVKAIIEEQGEAWNEFKSVQDNRFETIEDNVRDFKNWMLQETSPFGSRNNHSSSTPLTEKDRAAFKIGRAHV